jgi:hypothetical protein
VSESPVTESPGEDDVAGPPATGSPQIDEALHDLGDLESTPVHQHHDRLSRAHETLQAALDPDAAGDHSSP